MLQEQDIKTEPGKRLSIDDLKRLFKPGVKLTLIQDGFGTRETPMEVLRMNGDRFELSQLDEPEKDVRELIVDPHHYIVHKDNVVTIYSWGRVWVKFVIEG